MTTWTREQLVGRGFGDTPTRSHAAHGPYYSDPSIYALETERVFAREWNLVCHETQIADAGDYLVAEIADESIYVIRGRDDVVRAFYNVCQHRGHQLLTGQGTVANVVVCPYHSWSYGTEGDLRGAPKLRQVPGFCKADVALTPVRIETVCGFVFVNLSDTAPTLRERAPRFEPILQSMVAEAADLRFVTTQHYDIAADWKIVIENFLEAYHVEFSGEAHQALARIIDTDTYRFELSGPTIEYWARGGEPDALPYESNDEPAFTNSRGAAFHQVYLYPHTTFSVFPGTNLLFVYDMRPNGPGRCAEDITFYALDTDISQASRTAEAYITERLNHEDVDLVEAVQRGVRSRGYRPGRLMVDESQTASWGEQFVHHFSQVHLGALLADG